MWTFRFSDDASYLQMRFYVTSEDAGEYLCHVRGVPSREEGESQEIINVAGGEYVKVIVMPPLIVCTFCKRNNMFNSYYCNILIPCENLSNLA